MASAQWKDSGAGQQSCRSSGFGLNWRTSRPYGFVGVTDSFRRRITGPCAGAGVSDSSGRSTACVRQPTGRRAVVAIPGGRNPDARAMADAMAAETLEAVRENILRRTKDTQPLPRHGAVPMPATLEALDANTLAIVL